LPLPVGGRSISDHHAVSLERDAIAMMIPKIFNTLHRYDDVDT
jgi:hypothetical protein